MMTEELTAITTALAPTIASALAATIAPLQAQMEEQAKRNEEQFAYVCAELHEIKANTIIVRDRVISEFEGISPAMKATIEQEMTAVTEPEVAEAIVSYGEELPVVEGVKPERQCNERGCERYTTGTVLTSLEGLVSHGELASAGNYVSKVLGQLFNIKFRKTGYRVELKPVIEALLVYYRTERKSARMY